MYVGWLKPGAWKLRVKWIQLVQPHHVDPLLQHSRVHERVARRLVVAVQVEFESKLLKPLFPQYRLKG
jgi:hypothetical protein